MQKTYLLTITDTTIENANDFAQMLNKVTGSEVEITIEGTDSRVHAHILLKTRQNLSVSEVDLETGERFMRREKEPTKIGSDVKSLQI